MTKLLLVEDDVNLGFVVKDYLETEGFQIEHFKNGTEALKSFDGSNFDLCILDIMLPDIDGYTVAQKIKARAPFTPIIFLTAKSQPDDRIKGLKLGVDDYITKPFLTEELLLRINAILKRSMIAGVKPRSSQNYFRLGKFRYYFNESTLKSESQSIQLTAKENSLLNLLANNRNSVVTREMGLEAIWGHGDLPDDSRIFDVYIAKLRKFFKDDDSVHIKSVHGKGYKLVIS